MRNAVFLRDLGSLVLIAADQRGDLDVWNALQGIEVLLAERALAGNADLHAAFLAAFLAFLGGAFFADLLAEDLPAPFCRMMWPTAVFEAGTV